MRPRLHRCFANGCAQQIPFSKLACLPHWKRVPRSLQSTIVEQWKHGLSNDSHPTPEYNEAVLKAREHLQDRDDKRQAERMARNEQLGV